MKKLNNVLGKAICGFALILLVAGCADILNGPGAPEARTGKVTLTIGSGPARTVAPGLDQFEKISLSFAGTGGTADLADLDVTGGSVEVELPLGSWDVTARAYSNAADENPAAASEAHAFSWDGETVSGDTRFVLVPAGTGPGTLIYTVTVPGEVALAGTGSRIRIEVGGAAFEYLDDDNFTDGEHAISIGEADVEVTLPAGRYVVDILLEDDSGKTAVFRESVVILSGLVTEFVYAPAADRFLDPDVRASLTDGAALSFESTQDDTAGIFVDTLTPVDDFSYTLAINAPGETNPVYFTMVKSAVHSVAVGGIDASLVSLAASGETLEGSEAGDGLAVFAVDTSSAMEEGGEFYFALSVFEEGKIPVEVAVTLTVEMPFIPLLWVDTSTGDDPETLVEVPVQEPPITTLQEALDWLASSSAVVNTKYVVKVSKDSTITGKFVDKKNVRITLRGIGGERKIYFDQSLPAQGYLTVGGGTSYSNVLGVFNLYYSTLVLDQNITVNGPAGNNYFVYVRGSDAALAMNPGSRITQSSTTPINVNTGTFIMYRDSSIENCAGGSYYIINCGGTFNMYDGAKIANNSAGAVVKVDGTFNMYDGAKITNNTVGSSTTSSSTQQYPTKSAVSLGNNGTFTMHGGEISNTNYRGVTVESTMDSQPALFVMKGGVIRNNGKSYLTNTSSKATYYPLGGGVYVGNYSAFRMEGGEISGNGVDDIPGSGIFVIASDVTENSRFVLNGPVLITDNSIGSRSSTNANFKNVIVIGSNFSSSGVIALDLCTLNANSTFSAFWKDRQLLRALDEGEDSITINSSIAGKFTVAGYYTTPSTPPVVPLSDLTYVINSSGMVVNLGDD